MQRPTALTITAVLMLLTAIGIIFLENGLYLPMNVEAVIELLIHLWATGFGLFAIATIWRHRKGIAPTSEVKCTRNP